MLSVVTLRYYFLLISFVANVFLYSTRTIIAYKTSTNIDTIKMIAALQKLITATNLLCLKLSKLLIANIIPRIGIAIELAVLISTYPNNPLQEIKITIHDNNN